MSVIIEFFKSFFKLFQKSDPTPLQDFATFSDLQDWFDHHDELRMPAPNLCDDYSRESRRLAEVDEYFLSCELVHQGQLYGAVIFPAPDGSGKPDVSVFHIANMAIVDDTQACYYVDLAWGKLIYLCQFIPGGQY